MFDPSARLFLRFRGKTTGPFSPAQVEQMRQLGRVTAFHEVSADGVEWVLAADAGLVVSTGMGHASAPSGVVPTPAASDELPWYHLDATGARRGPIPRVEMAGMVAAGKFEASSEVWCEGFADWARLDRTELAGLLPRKGSAVAKGTTQLIADPVTPPGNGVVIAGYLCCVGSLFLCPPVFGVAALACAVVNLSRRRVSHGLAQLFLSIVLTSAGSLLGYLVWQELGRQ